MRSPEKKTSRLGKWLLGLGIALPILVVVLWLVGYVGMYWMVSSLLVHYFGALILSAKCAIWFVLFFVWAWLYTGLIAGTAAILGISAGGAFTIGGLWASFRGSWSK